MDGLVCQNDDGRRVVDDGSVNDMAIGSQDWVERVESEVCGVVWWVGDEETRGAGKVHWEREGWAEWCGS